MGVLNVQRCNGFTNIRVNFYNDGKPPGYPSGGLGKLRLVTFT
jgi:hypothetical protein